MGAQGGSPQRLPAPGDTAVARRLYEDLLGRYEVAGDDGFFALGGSSLHVELLLERVERALGVRVPVEAFYADPTLTGLQGMVGAARPASQGAAGDVDLAAALDRVAAAAPSRPAVVGPETTLTYGALAEAVAAASDDVAPGAGPIVRRLPSTPDGACAVLGWLARGAPTLLLDPAATHAEEEQAWSLFTSGVGPGDPPLPARVHAVVTSGSTGQPKVVVTPTAGVLANRLEQAWHLGVRPDDVLLVTAPLHYGYGLGAGLLLGLLAGATVVLPGLPLRPATLRRAVEQHRPTLVMGVGLAYRLLLAAEVAPPDLRWALVSGEPLAPQLADAWTRRTGVPLADGYGTSETGHVSTDVDGVPGSVGRPLPGVEVRLRGDGSLADEGVGELLIRTPAVAHGYAGAPELTTARFADGWFRSGDLAELRPDGHLLLRGRLDDQLNVAGTKVDPREVEGVCRQALDVRECVVAGRPAPSGRTEVCLFVVADRRITRADLVRALTGRLSTHKIPTRVVQLETLPRGSGGKVLPGELPW